MRFTSVRRFGSAVLLACVLALPAAAQETAAKPSPEHLALARAVLDFTGAGKSFDAILPKLLSDARSMILRTRPTLQPDLDPAVLAVAAEMKNSDEELIQGIALIYAQKFTEAELKQIAAFYQSPAGQKLTTELPGVLAESYKLIQEWSREMSVEVMTKLRVEMKKKGHDL